MLRDVISFDRTGLICVMPASLKIRKVENAYMHNK